MKKVIVTLSLITATALYGAAALFQLFPVSDGNSVLVEKSKEANGNRISMILPKNFTKEQGKLMNSAYEIAKADGHKSPEIVQAVLLQESMAGGVKSYRVANAGPEAYFGPMQIKLATAKDVLQRFPALFEKYNLHTHTDDEIKANLILNDKFNIEVASKYLLILQKHYGFSGKELLNAYNRGPGGVKDVGSDYHYALGAQQKLAMYQAKL